LISLRMFHRLWPISRSWRHKKTGAGIARNEAVALCLIPFRWDPPQTDHSIRSQKIPQARYLSRLVSSRGSAGPSWRIMRSTVSAMTSMGQFKGQICPFR
jgi:hypothetical protein